MTAPTIVSVNKGSKARAKSDEMSLSTSLKSTIWDTVKTSIESQEAIALTLTLSRTTGNDLQITVERLKRRIVMLGCAMVDSKSINVPDETVERNHLRALGVIEKYFPKMRSQLLDFKEVSLIVKLQKGLVCEIGIQSFEQFDIGIPV
ncbi:MAG: hypothetical protein KME11_05130 [Timaviella obliquedivisa GSE-PSE-MK23-08B]|jgi:hypothetical protein|nr:hypothetical protein [Timaviella obliquedivisa GSE-PSE-MK23-08B]